MGDNSLWPEGWTIIEEAGGRQRIKLGTLTAHVNPVRKRRGEYFTALRILDGDEMAVGWRRLNLTSSSSVGGIRGLRYEPRSLEAALLAEFVQIMADRLVQQAQAVPRTSQPDLEADMKPFHWLLHPIWPDSGATAVAGAPAAMKSLFGTAIALQVASGVAVLGDANTRPPRRPRNVLYMDWEDDEHVFQGRARALVLGREGMDLKSWLHYGSYTQPLADLVHDLIEEVERHEIEAVVIDSMTAAIGGSMLEGDTVNSFWDACHALGVPALVLAHKSAQNIKDRRSAMYGSMVSLARVRMAWNVEVDVENEQKVRWDSFKFSHGRKPSHLAWQVRFRNENDPTTGGTTLRAVSLTGISPDEVSLDEQRPGTTRTRPEQLTAFVAAREGGVTKQQVADEFGGKVDSVYQRLREQVRKGLIRSEGPLFLPLVGGPDNVRQFPPPENPYGE